MAWKQPIPTNLETIFGEDYRLIQLFKELLYRACNVDCRLSLDSKKFVSLKRGQVLFGRNKFGEYLCWDARSTSRSLDRLVLYTNPQNMTKLVTKQSTTNYTVVTILNYEEWVSLDQADDQAVTKQRPSSDQAVTTSKSIKSDKSVKIDKKKIENISKIILPETENINSLISKFQKINPSYKTFYANKTQRKSLENMIQAHGIEKMAKVIDALPTIVVKPYAPKITSPYELEKLFGKLVLFISQEKNNGKFEQYR